MAEFSVPGVPDLSSEVRVLRRFFAPNTRLNHVDLLGPTRDLLRLDSELPEMGASFESSLRSGVVSNSNI